MKGSAARCPEALLPLLWLLALTCSSAQADSSTHTTLIEHDGSFYGRFVPPRVPNLAPRARVAQAFYETHGDFYDFLVVLPTFQVNLEQEGTLGLHTGVHNDVLGLGPNRLYDQRALFGGARRLKGYLDIRMLGPNGELLPVETLLGTLAHEVAHQWGSYVRYRDPATQQLRGDLLGQEDSHWSFFLDSNGSVLYGADWQQVAPGAYSAGRSRVRYSPLDLYLMGMLAPEEVGPITLLEPQGNNSPPVQADALPPPEGRRLSALPRTLSIQDIIAAEGPRHPGASQSQKHFRAAFILLTAPGQAPTPAQLALAESLRRRFEDTFFVLTRGRGIFETELLEVPPDSATPRSVQRAVDYLLARQQPLGGWASRPNSPVRETHLVLEALRLFYADARVPLATERGRDYLLGLALREADGLARRALATGDTSAATLARLTALGQGGTGLGRGYQPTVIDSVLVGLALRQAGAVPPAALTAFLLGQRNADGGWPLAHGGPSRLEPSALVLEYLSRLELPTSEVRQAVDRGLVFLESRRGPQGLYLEDGSSVRGTGWALVSLYAAGRLSAQQAALSAEALLARQRQNGSWEDSLVDTALALRALRIALSPNLRLVAPGIQLSRRQVLQGEPVLANLQVLNTGYVQAQALRVRALDSEGRTLGTSEPFALAPGGSTQVSFTLDTSASGGSVQAFFVVDPDGQVDESSEADNRVAVPLVVLPPPAGAELSVSSVSLTPDRLGALPGAVRVLASLANRGLSEARQVGVVVRLGSAVLASSRVDLPPQHSRALTWDVVVSDLDSSQQVVVQVDPADEVDEQVEDDNTASALLRRVPGVDLRVENIHKSPSTVVQGDTVRVYFTIRNTGTSEAVGQTQVEIRQQPGGALVATLPTSSFVIPSRGDAARHEDWRATTAGPIRAVVRVVSAEDLNPSNNQGVLDFEVGASAKANLQVAATSLRVSPTPPLEGQETTFHATVQNTGPGEASSFAVDWCLGDPAQGGTCFRRQSVARLAANSSLELSASYVLPRNGSRLLFVVVDPEGAVEEFDEQDNRALLTLDTRPIADLVVSAADIQPGTLFPAEGATVPVKVWASNAGGQPAEGVEVELLLAVQGRPEQSLGVRSLASLAAGEQKSVEFTWNTTGVRGAARLVAVVNRRGTVEEQRSDNNRAERAVHVQDGALALTEPFFSPNADGVKDATELVYRLQEAAPVQVRVLDAQGQPVRTLQAEPTLSGRVVWDGRSDQGLPVVDGTYRLRVSSTVQGRESMLGTLEAVVDTNRFPLERAPAGTLEEESLETTVSFPPPLMSSYGSSYSSLYVATPDEEGVLLVGVEPGSERRSLYFQPLGGGEAQRLLPEGWGGQAKLNGGLAVSGDGQTVAFTAEAKCPESFRACTTLYVLSRASGQVRPVATSDTTGTTRILDMPLPLLDARGTRLFFVRDEGAYNSSDHRLHLESVRTDGTDRRLLSTHRMIAEVRLSPDGQSLTYIADQALYQLPVEGGTPVELLPRGTFFSFILPGSGWRIDAFPAAGSRHIWLPDARGIVFAAGGPVRPVWLPGEPLTFYELIAPGLRRLDLGTRQVQELFIGRPGIVEHNSSDFLAEQATLLVNPLSGGVLFRYQPESWLPAQLLRLDSPGQATPVLPYFREGLRMSPGGSFLYGAFSDSAQESRSYGAIVSTANLRLRLGTTRSPSSAAITFQGTAADLNFESYELSVRPWPARGSFTLVTRSATPVVRGTLASWVPPAPGVYEVQLLARDRAGNVRTRRAFFNYNNRPLLADISREPALFSPNGDGVLDTVRVRYRTTAPTSVELRILDSSGQVVRRVQRTHPSEGSEPWEWVWDGRDDTGERVADGRYVLALGESRFNIDLDTTAPAAELELVREQGPGSPMALSFPTVRPVSVPYQGLEQPVQIAAARLRLRASDPHLRDWQLERKVPGAAGAPTVVVAGNESLAGERGLAVAELRGEELRLRVRDAAGNESLTAPQSLEERLLVTFAGEAEAVDGTWLLPGRSVPRLAPFENVLTAGSEPTLTWRGNKRYAFGLDPSVSGPLVSFRIAYLPRGGAQWIEDPTPLQNLSGELVLWDTSALPAVEQFELRAQDAQGRPFTTQRVRFLPPPDTSGTDRLAGCVRTREGESTHLRLELYGLRTQAQRLAPGATWAFESLEGHPGTVRLPLSTQAQLSLGQVDASGRRPLELIDSLSTASLPGCRYAVTFEGRLEDGTPLRQRGEVQLCAVQLAVRGGTVVASESLRQGLRSLEVFTSHAGREMRLANLGRFEGLSLPQPLDQSRLEGGREYVLGARAILEDGTQVLTRSATLEQGGEACRDTASLRTQPNLLTLSTPRRVGAVPVCQSLPPTWLLQVQGTLGTGQTFASLRVDLQGITRASLPVEGFVPGSASVQGSVEAQGSSLAEGLYWPVAVATLADGQRLEAPAPRPLIIDRSLPQVSLAEVSPPRVCKVTRPQPDGSQRQYLAVQGSVEDEHLESYELRLLGGSQLPEPYTRNFDPRVPTSVVGSLGEVDVSGIEGQFQLQLSARDVSGSSCPVRVPIELADTVAVRQFLAQPVLLSPGAPEPSGNTELSFTLSQGAAVTLSAWRDNTEVGTLFSSSLPPGLNSLLWDGTLPGESEPLEDGSYRLVLRAVDACEARGEASTLVRLDRTLPTARIDTPSEGEAVGAMLVVTGEASDTNFSRYTLDLEELGEDGQPRGRRTVSSSLVPAQGVLATLATDALAGSRYVLWLRVVDGAGNSREISRSFQLAPRGLIRFATAVPFLSVNQGTELQVDLAAPGTLSAELVSTSGSSVRQLLGPRELGNGPSSLDISAGSFQGLEDGDYRIRVTVAGAARSETALVPLALDRTAPRLSVTSPEAGAFTRASLTAQGSIEDERLAAWELRHAAPGQQPPGTLVAQGGAPAPSVLAVLDTLGEGQHRLILTARDLAGNVAAPLEVSFTVDTSAPRLTFQAPLAGSFVRGMASPYTVRARVEEEWLGMLRLEWARSRSGPRQVLIERTQLPAGGQLSYDWSTAGEADGAAVLYLVATDRAGNQAESSVELTLDNTPPVARLLSPRGVPLGQERELRGTAGDDNLAEWRLELGRGEPGAATDFVTVASASQPVSQGVLARLVTLPADGPYVARLTVTDKAGHTETDTAPFTVDSQPPPGVPSLSAVVRQPATAVLTWQAPSPASDVVAYEVLRASSGEPVLEATVPATEDTWADERLADGTFRYTVRALDAAGNRGPSSPPASVRIDNTPPVAALLRPTPGQSVAGTLEVRGLASGEDFKEYRLYLGEGSSPGAYTLLASSPLPVSGGRLLELDTRTLPQGLVHTLRLEAEDLSGNVAEALASFTPDNEPPAVPLGLSAQVQQSDVHLSWQANSEQDVLGYLLLRNGELLGVSSGRSPVDLRPYAVACSHSPCTYVDRSVPDGTYTYSVLAIDRAGNPSLPSNPANAAVDTRAPSVSLVQPAYLARLPGAAELVATTPDADVASVRFKVRTRPDLPLIDLGEDQAAPWVQRLEVSSMGERVTEVYAEASEPEGPNRKTGVSPVLHLLREPRPPTPALSARVDGRHVRFSWSSPQPEGQLAGFELLRGSVPVRPQPEPLSVRATATDSCFGTTAQQAIDGRNETSWSLCYRSATWQVVFENRRALLAGVRLRLRNASVAVEGRIDGFWLLLGNTSVGDDISSPLISINPQLELEALRLVVTPFSISEIYEVTLQEVPLERGSEAEAELPIGEHTVSLSAVGFGGTRSERSTAQVRIYAPRLEVAENPTVASSTTLLGYEAAPGATVELLAAGSVIASTTANATGDFSFHVQLQLGENTFRARATDALGNSSMESAPLTMVRDQAPDTEVSLALVGVQGSSVELSFEVSGDTSQLSGFALLRESAGTLARVATAGPEARTFTDSNVPNGSYIYRVVPLSSLGAQGTPSNPVAVQVVLELAPPVALAMTASPEGGELVLRWQPGDARAVAFQVERAQGATATFEPLELTQQVQLIDRPLVNGALYRYRVRAVDEAGNVSAPSAVVEGVPRDQTPPERPVLTAPTYAGWPVTRSSPTTTVVGTAEAGSLVRLLRDGLVVAEAIASAPVGSSEGRFEFQGVVLRPGLNLFSATATDAALNTSLWALPIQVSLNASQLPDLVAEVRLQPALPYAGQPVNAYVTVRNVGQGAAGASSLELTLRGHGGSVRLLPAALVPALGPASSTTLAFALPVQGLQGAQVLEVAVDAGGAVAEADRSNNLLSHPFTLLTEGLPTVAVALSPSTVRVNGRTTATFTLSNPGAPRPVQVGLRLVDGGGRTARAYEPPEGLELPAGGTLTRSREVEVGTLPAGDYALQVSVREGTTLLAEGSAPLTIAPDRAAQLALTPLRPRYFPGEQAVVRSSVRNTSLNASLAGATLVLSLWSEGGTQVEGAERTVSLPVLPLGGTYNVETALETAGLAVGRYRVQGSVRLGSQELVVAETFFQVEGRPLLQGQLTLTALQGAPPALPVGGTVAVAWAAANRGSASANVLLRLVVSQPETLAPWRELTLQTGELVPGAQLTGSHSLSTAGWPLGIYPLTLVAEQASASTQVLATARLRVRDGSAPVLELLYPANGQFVRGTLAPQVQVSDESSGVQWVRVQVGTSLELPLLLASGSRLQGQWSAPLSLETEGPHTLVFSAADAEGNVSTLPPVTVVRDTLPPVLTLTGVPQVPLVAGPVIPLFSATDAHLDSVSATLNGAAFASGTPISQEGDYTLEVRAVDRAGNLAAAGARFTVDATPPRISIGGVVDGAFYSREVRPSVTVVDANPGSFTVRLDGQPFSSDEPVSAEGTYVLSVEAVDAVGRTARAQVTFTVDRTPPGLTLQGVEEGAFVNAPVTPRAVASDANLLSVSETLDGRAYTGVPVADEGPHVYEATAYDKAGNSASASRRFTVDRTPPAIVILGVQPGAEYTEPVVPTVEVSDANLLSSQVRLNGQPFASGTRVEADGEYLLTVRAEDRAGNVAERSVAFVLRTGRVEVDRVQRGTGRRLLALVRAGSCAALESEVVRVRSFLAAHVPQPQGPLALVTEEAAFLEAVRSGVYDVYLVLRLEDRRPPCGGGSSGSQVGEAWARALTEQLFSGRAGLVVLQSRPDNQPDLREALGVDAQGLTSERSVRFTAPPMQGLAALTSASSSVRLKLVGSGATVVARYGSGSAEAAAVNVLGRGHSATFGFDLTRASPPGEAGAALRRALEWVQPPPRALQPLSVSPVDISLINRGNPVRVRTRALLPEGMAALWASPPGSLSAERRSATWEVDMLAGGAQSHHALVRLPEGPASPTVLFDVEVVAPVPRPVGLYPLVLPVAASGADLLARARQEAARLPSSGPDRVVRLRIESLLLAVERRAPTRRVDVESNLESLFRAVEETRKLRVDGTAVRLALDDLIGYWEARWFTF